MELRPSKSSRSSLNKHPSSLHGTRNLLAYWVHRNVLFYPLLSSRGCRIVQIRVLWKNCRQDGCFTGQYLLLKLYVVVGYRSRCSDWLRAGRSGDRIPVGAKFTATVKTNPGAHSVSCTMGTGSFPGVNCDRGVLLSPHPLLAPRSLVEYSYTSTPLRATTEPVTGILYLLDTFLAS